MKLNPQTCKKLLHKCKCGNDSNFDFKSRQTSEDSCEVWIECGVCGFDPAGNTYERIETVMGERNNFTAGMAAAVWNTLIEQLQAKERAK